MFKNAEEKAAPANQEQPASAQQTEGRVTAPEIIDSGLSGTVPPNAPQELNDGGGALRPS